MEKHELETANQQLMDKRAAVKDQTPKPISEKMGQTFRLELQPSADDDTRCEAAIWECDDCGESVKPFTWTLGEWTRYIMRQFCDCSAGQAKKAVYEQDLMHDEWRKLADRLIAPLERGIYKTFTFAHWDKSRNAPGSTKTFAELNEYVDQVQIDEPNWLYLSGSNGLGKTHLAIAALRKIAAIRLWQPHVIVWPELCSQTQESWSSHHGPTEGQLWGKARAAKILLIDDLDKTSTGEWAMSKLFTLINYRLQHLKPTIFTANTSLTKLVDDWGKPAAPDHVKNTGRAILSRIGGQLLFCVEFEGKDQRWAK